MYYYGARYYDPRISIFVSVDPLAEQFVGWTPYHYVHQNPINLIDPTGMSAESADGGIKEWWDKAKSWFTKEPAYENIPANKNQVELGELEFNGFDFGNAYSGEPCVKCHHSANIGDLNFEVSPYTQGTLNILGGTLGTVGAATYVIGTEGVGAAFGGATALTFSISQITLGVGQIADAWQEGNNQDLQASGSLLGYGARINNSPYADYIDAGSSLMTTQFGSPGGIYGALSKNIQQIKKGNNVIKNSYELYDTSKAAYDLGTAKIKKKDKRE